MRPSAKYDSFSMKPAIILIYALLLSSSAHAQAPSSYFPQQKPAAPPGPVPISEEPHHRQTRTPPDSARWRNALFARKLRAPCANRFRRAFSQHHHRTHSSAGHLEESLQGSAARTARGVSATANRRWGKRECEREHERQETTGIRGRRRPQL